MRIVSKGFIFGKALDLERAVVVQKDLLVIPWVRVYPVDPVLGLTGGLDDIARLRVHLLNGGNIQAADFDLLVKGKTPLVKQEEIRQTMKQGKKKEYEYAPFATSFFKEVNGMPYIDSFSPSRKVDISINLTW